MTAVVADGQAITVVLEEPMDPDPMDPDPTLSSLTITSDTARAKISISTNYGIDALDVSDSDGLETTITAGRDLTIGTLTAGANTIILSGSRDLTIDSTDAAGINATAMRGDLTINAYTGSTKLVASGGRGINNIAAGDGAVTEYAGGQGVDILDASGVTNGTLDLVLNGGSDVLKLGGTSTSGLIVALDGGSGTDTIHLSDNTNLTDIRTFALRSVEQFELENLILDTRDAQVGGRGGRDFYRLTVEWRQLYHFHGRSG